MGWTEHEMDLAHRLIDTLADKWKPDEFRDTTPRGCARPSRRRSRARSWRSKKVMGAGFDAFQGKPISVRELLETVRRILDKSAAA
jgi:hypothetical protein